MKRPKLIFEIDRAKNKEFFVRIVMRNGKQTFTSGETYKRIAGAANAIKALVVAIAGQSYEVRDLTKSVATHKRK